MARQKTLAPPNPKVVNLLLTAVAAFYLAELAFNLTSGKVFNTMGADFLSFWSSGYIANTVGYPAIYDLQTQAQVQGSVSAAVADYGVVPTPLFPVFILPFQLFALLPARISFWVWGILNTALAVLYLKLRFGASGGFRHVWMAALSIPVYMNLYWGQVEVWLMIFVGEFFHNLLEKKDITSGFWLGGLLLKPQVLIFILPYLLYRRAWKVLLGFAISSLVVLGLSFALVGLDGLEQMIGLWFNYAGGMATNAPEVMINWRMLGHHIGRWTLPAVGSLVILLGTLATLAVLIVVVRRSARSGATASPLVLLGLFAATLSATWHAHQHMAMILLPFLIYLLPQKPRLRGLFTRWVLILPAVFVAVYLLAVPMALGWIPLLSSYGGFLSGTAALLLNLLFLVLALRSPLPSVDPELPAAPLPADNAS